MLKTHRIMLRRMNITDGYYEFVGRKTTVYIAHMRNMVLIY